MDPINQASVLGAGQALVPNYLDQSIKQHLAPLQLQGAQLQNDALALQNQAARSAIEEQGQFHTDLQQVMLHPSPENMAGLILRHPKYAEQVKAAHGLMDKAQQQKDLTSMGSIFAAASNGKYDLASNLLEGRIAADTAAGHPPDATDAALLQAFKSGDPKEQKAAVGMIGPHLAALVGPDKFSEVYGALSKDKGFTLGQGQTRYDEDGNPIASIEAKPDFLVIPEGGKAVPLNSAARGAGVGAGAGAANAKGSTVGGGAAKPGFDAAMEFILPHEGGYAASDGNGQPVNFGINQGANPGVDVKNLTRDGAKAIYRDKYWAQSGAEKLPENAQTAFFDTYIINPGRAKALWQQAGGDVNKFLDLRDGWLNGLVASDPGKYGRFQKAWTQRTSDLRTLVSANDDGEEDAPPPAARLAPTRAGDPSGTLYGNPKPKAAVLAPAQAQALGLDPKKVYQQSPDGSVHPVGDATANEVPMGNPNLSGDAYLKSLPGNIASQVKALAEGRLGLPSSFALAKPYWQRMLQATAQYDPSFDAQRAQARKAAITAFTGNGKGAQIVGSVNRAANHLSTLYQASEKLVGPDTGFSPLNSLLAYGGQRFQPQDLKAYNSALPLVAGELEKIARGSTGTLHGVEQIMANLSPNESLTTRRQAIKTAIELIHGAIEPLKNGYNSAFDGSSARPSIPWVDPTAQRIYKKIGGIDFSLDGGSAPAQGGGHAGGLPAGAHQIGVSKSTGKPVYQLPDGRKVSPQ